MPPHSYPFIQVDAFTTQPFGGNPCPVFFDADDLSEAEMLTIAREMNQSETAFVMRSDRADVRARYFTISGEIPLAGHPTIATIYALVASKRVALQGGITPLRLELQVGPIDVEIHATDGQVTQIVMTQKPPTFTTIHDPAVVMPLFGLTADDVYPNAPIQTVSTGTPQFMIPIATHDALRRIVVNHSAVAAYHAQSDFFSPHLFCVGGVTPQGDTFARHFGPPPRLMEDPVTGSATGGMGAYMWRYRMIHKSTFVAEQGHWMGRPGTIYVTIEGERERIENIKIGGAAVAVLEGVLNLPI